MLYSYKKEISMKLFILLLAQITLTYILLAENISYKLDNNTYVKNKHHVYLQPSQELTLKFDIANAKQIRWYQVIPDSTRFYKNANHPWEKNAYKWTGYGKIDYKRVELKAFRNKKKIKINTKLLEQTKPKDNPYYNTKLGSFWFEAEATLKNGEKIRSYGLKDRTKKGLSPKVFRVSYWQDDSYIGYLTTFFNVPGIFGSMPYQSANHIGVDCADVLIGASALMNKKTKVKNYNVKMLEQKLKHKAKFKIINGHPNVKLRWGKDFKKGDFIAVKYHKDGRYAHIGMLYEDVNKNGILDKADSIMNAGPNALHTVTLKDRAFNGTVVILENKDI